MAKTILLADDSITIQKIVNLTFVGEGIAVVTASNGDTALRKVYEVRPDLVLADIFMPGKNGYELCEHIKSEPQLSRIPVILLVGAFEPFDNKEATRVKADAHLTKPFEIKVLISAVNSLISAAEEERVLENAKEERVGIGRPQGGTATASLVESVGSLVESSQSTSGAPPIPDFTTSIEPAMSASELPYLVSSEAALDEPKAQLDHKQNDYVKYHTEAESKRVGRSDLEIASIGLEGSDPLGLYTTDSMPGLAASEAEGSLDSRSLALDIWKSKVNWDSENDVLPEIAEEKQESLTEEIFPQGKQISSSTKIEWQGCTAPDSASQESVPPVDAGSLLESAVSVEEELANSGRAFLAAPISQNQAGKRLPDKDLDQAELVDLIANKVVEKLSKEVIEKIAWEVIPDLAEMMIKEHLKSHLKGTEKPKP